MIEVFATHIRHRTARIWFTLAIVITFTIPVGCGIQLGGAARVNPDVSRVNGTVEIGGRLHRIRRSGPYASVDITAASRPEDGPSIRNATFGAGYHLVIADAFRIELGPELGAGEPGMDDYQSTGLYLGGASAFLFRIPVFCDQQDNMVGVAPLGCALDLVANLRAGRWSRAMMDDGPGHWELCGGLGVRLSFFSDMLMASHDSWEGPWTDQ